MLQLIERGGMGAVYLAEDQTLQRRVAIKIIHPEFTDDPDYQKRFTREALTVAAFQHPNIVTVYASGWLQGKQYIVMEYVAGGTLHDLLLSRRPTRAEALDIIYNEFSTLITQQCYRELIHARLPERLREAMEGLLELEQDDIALQRLRDDYLRTEPDAERAHAAEELIDVVRSYLK